MYFNNNLCSHQVGRHILLRHNLSAIKMLKLLPILEMILAVLLATGRPGEILAEYKTTNILPLVLIRTEQNEFIHLITFKPMKYEENFIFGTEFSAAEEGDQLFFCGGELNGEKSKNPIDAENVNLEDQYCAHELIKPESDGESTSNEKPVFLKCEREPQPFVRKLTVMKHTEMENEVSCGPSPDKQIPKGKMFAFMYKFKTNKDHKVGTFEVFRFCYDEENKRVLYTEHAIRATALLHPNNTTFEFERSREYEMSAKSYGDFGTEYETIKNAYEELKIIKRKQKYSNDIFETSQITHKFLLSDQKLVPTDDMAFASWRLTTYHYLNTMPMGDGRIKLWDFLSKFIRYDAIKRSREYRIYTGAFDHTKEGKDDKDAIQSPDIWIKIVHYKCKTDNKERNQSLAVVMIHNPKIEKVKTYFNNICKENFCKDKFYENFPEYNESICCVHPATVANDFFGLELQTHELLDIQI